MSADTTHGDATARGAGGASSAGAAGGAGSPGTGPGLDRAIGMLQATATNIISMVGVGPFLTIPFRVAAMDGPHVALASCANGYGLFCMAENVHEWCANWYRPYDAEDPGAPGPAKTPRRASRGGSWRHREKTTRVKARSSLSPVFRYSDFGMRVYADAERVGARTSRL